jgi:hypothetical protein
MQGHHASAYEDAVTRGRRNTMLIHVNVWFTATYTDLLGASTMGGLYSWIRSAGGLAGFNHPGREAGRFNDFAPDATVGDSFVGLEMFHRRPRWDVPASVRRDRDVRRVLPCYAPKGNSSRSARDGRGTARPERRVAG